METPRCGMKDMSKNLIGAKRKRRYTLQGSTWQKKVHIPKFLITIPGADLEVRHSNTDESVLYYKRKAQ